MLTDLYTKCIITSYLLHCEVCYALLNHVQLFATPWAVDHQAPRFMAFSRQEYWSEISEPFFHIFFQFFIPSAYKEKEKIVLILIVENSLWNASSVFKAIHFCSWSCQFTDPE